MQNPIPPTFKSLGPVIFFKMVNLKEAGGYINQGQISTFEQVNEKVFEKITLRNIC